MLLHSNWVGDCWSLCLDTCDIVTCGVERLKVYRVCSSVRHRMDTVLCKCHSTAIQTLHYLSEKEIVFKFVVMFVL